MIQDGKIEISLLLHQGDASNCFLACLCIQSSDDSTSLFLAMNEKRKKHSLVVDECVYVVYVVFGIGVALLKSTYLILQTSVKCKCTQTIKE